MFRFNARRHRYLMNESEQALEDASHGEHERHGRIATQILNDPKYHRLWESRHAELVTPIAEQSRRDQQVFRLRDLEVKLLHRRSLIRCIRKYQIQGDKRDKLLEVFYGPKDKTDAILLEHRQYTLAVSSRVSADHLINVMHDPVGFELLDRYEETYSRYFELYCFYVTCLDAVTKAAVAQEMAILRRTAMRILKRIHSERPPKGHASFERQADLARSGRYKILDYMPR